MRLYHQEAYLALIIDAAKHFQFPRTCPKGTAKTPFSRLTKINLLPNDALIGRLKRGREITRKIRHYALRGSLMSPCDGL